MRHRLATILAAGLALSMPAAAKPADDTYRWRVSVNGATAQLFAAEAEATDFTGAFSFRCDLGAGTIEATVTVHETDQKSFARIIADDLYPAVTFRGDPAERSFTLIERITYGEAAGWEFRFSLAEDAYPMEALQKTGALFLSVGTVYATDIDLKAGLDAVAAFRRHCRKDPVRLRR